MFILMQMELTFTQKAGNGYKRTEYGLSFIWIEQEAFGQAVGTYATTIKCFYYFYRPYAKMAAFILFFCSYLHCI